MDSVSAQAAAPASGRAAMPPRKPGSPDSMWDSLEEDEAKAAEQLGWDFVSWCASRWAVPMLAAATGETFLAALLPSGGCASKKKGGLGKSARAPRRDDGEFPEGLAGWARLSEEERACAATLFHTAATWDELVRSAGASQPRRT